MSISEALQNIDRDALACEDDFFLRAKRAEVGFAREFGSSDQLALFSAPGRIEIGGNHTDHQRGCVLAAAINMDVLGVAAPRDDMQVCVHSEGYPVICLDIQNTDAQPSEAGTTAALVRGVADGFRKRGYKAGGFNAYATSTVWNGSGLSSSAAFEVWLATIVNECYNDGRATPTEIAQISQYAENVHFGKPCGLMDMMASAYGGILSIDFAQDPPHVRPIHSSLPGYAICIVNSGADHADLTQAYADITLEMKAVAQHFGQSVLADVSQHDFMQQIPTLRKAVGDRAVLRALHFFHDTQRAVQQAELLESGDISAFLQLVRESGQSSFMHLQNINVPGQTQQQEVAVALALCENLLDGQGACRVHGGGFAGTVEAFVPLPILPSFEQGIAQMLGEDMCHVVRIRSQGACKLG